MADTHVTSGFITIGSGLSLVGSGMSVISSASGNTVSLTPGTTVQLAPAGVFVMSGQVNTSVSGNVVNISGQQVQTSISGNSVNIPPINISGNIVQTSVSGNVVTIAQPVSLATNVILTTIGVSGMAINVLPDQSVSSGMMFVGFNKGPNSSTNEWFVGGSNSGSTPFASIDPSTGVRTTVGWDQPLDILIPVTNMNQLAVTTFSGGNGILSLWAITVSGS